MNKLKKSKYDTVILGAGVTGLSAGFASGLPVFEATDVPGGICASYYMRPFGKNRLFRSPKDEEVYRFEIGGGHWIFGGDPLVLQFINKICPVKRYNRQSSVFFPNKQKYVPYPLQNNLRYLDTKTIKKVLNEIKRPRSSFRTMEEWLQVSFGPTLCKLFFAPFHSLYTAGLHSLIAPQDAYKSPVNIKEVERGASGQTKAVGYNTDYLYPTGGLDSLTHQISKKCNVNYEKRVIAIDAKKKEIFFSDQSCISYKTIISTLPINRVVEMTGLPANNGSNPFTSVLVLNIGAIKGSRCPDDHWIYVPQSRSGFHRVGFYSNVDSSFMIKSSRKLNDRVSIYVEKAYPNGLRPSEAVIRGYMADVVRELQEWGYIEKVEVADPTWIDVAYTWSYPQSNWTNTTLKLLETKQIYQVGRYGRWVFQGIADSIKDGFYAGASFRGRF